MADLSITAANVLPGAGATTADGTAGETVTAGQTAYRKASDGRLWKAFAAETAGVYQWRCVGVFAEGAAAGQPVKYYNGGQVFIGATTAVGQVYIVSPTAAGGLAPLADALNTGDYTTIVGVGDSTTTIKLVRGFTTSDAQHA